MAQQALPPQILSNDITKPLLRRAFDLIDKNGDGQLQKEEFSTGCDSMGFDLSKDECNAVFSLVDDDGSGEIDFDEFCSFILKSNDNDSKELKEFRSRLIAIVSDVSKQTLRNAFDLIDKNGDGHLQKDEFAEGCVSMGIQLNKNELDAVFNCIDVDGSGEIDFDEFAEFLQPQKKNAAHKQFGQFRQKLMTLLHSNSFEDYYHFQINDIVVLQLFNGKALAVNGDQISGNGDFGVNAQFNIQVTDDGKRAYIQSIQNGKYVKIDGDNVVLGEQDDNARFKVRRVSIGYFKLESELNGGKFIAVDSKSGLIVVGKGDPFCRIRALRRGRRPIFSAPYLFAIKNIVVLEHRLGQHIRINSEDSTELNLNGGKGTLSQWEANPIDGGKYVSFKSIVTDKYLRIYDNNKIDAGGDNENDSKFKVYPGDGPNHVRLESVKFPESFIGVDENGVAVNKGDKFSLLTIYRKN